jgi:hypothetical protein
MMRKRKENNDMKEIWIRVGMTVKVTESQYEELRKASLDKEASEAYGYSIYRDLDDLPDWFEKKIEEGAVIDGDSYIPSECW